MLNEQELYALISKRIRELRQAKNISQKQLAKKLSIDKSYIIRIENHPRNITIYNLWRICHALGIGLDEFFSKGKDLTRFFENNINT